MKRTSKFHTEKHVFRWYYLKRGDQWWKPLGFVLLMIHWFNPLVWAAYILFCWDLELACDESAVRDFTL